MEQHPVPQHIASFEFKLFGNLTVRQFVTLAIPMTIAALFFFSTLPAFLRYTLAVIFGGGGLLAALVPIQGRPLDKWAVLFIKAIMAPTQRIWVKDAKLPEFLDVVVSRVPASEGLAEPITGQDKQRLKAYLRSLPRGQVSPFDVKEQIAIARLNLSTEGAAAGKLPPAVMWMSESGGRGLSQAVPQVTAAAAGSPTSAGLPLTSQEYQGAMAEALPHIANRPKISAHAKPYVLPGLEKRFGRSEHYKPRTVEPKVQLASDTNFTVENVIPIATPGRRVRLVHGVGKVRARKLHFAPPEGFDLSNLPIRGEARFEVSESLKKRLSADLFEEERPVFTLQKQVVVEQPRKPRISIADTASANVTRLAQSAQPIHQADIVKSGGTAEQKDTKMQVTSSGALKAGLKPAEILTKAQIVPLSNKPNVLSGIVVDSFGAPIEGAIITVRDENGVPIRALKANKLGQFLSATPLQNGKYTLEIEATDASFEPLQVSVSGEVLAPMAIKPKGTIDIKNNE